MRPEATLNLWKKQLGAVPDWVWERTDVEALVLADNGLTRVSERIAALNRLRVLDLGHNHLAQVPAALGELEGLTDFLYLHDNRLEQLPSALEKLTTLRYLNIGENKFETLPECVCAMIGLIE